MRITTGVVIDASGTVIDKRPFPPGKDSPYKVGDRTIIRLTQPQMGVVDIGWVTADDGKTFHP